MIHQHGSVEERIQPGAETKSSDVQQKASRQISQYVESQPVKSVLIGLGAGIGAGLVLGACLRESSSLISQQKSLRDQIGHQVKDSLSEILPDSLKKHFGA